MTKRVKFQVAIRPGRNSPFERVEISGHKTCLDGIIVHKSVTYYNRELEYHDFWNISHGPSGIALVNGLRSFDKREQALRFCEILQERWPEADWTIEDPQELMHAVLAIGVRPIDVVNEIKRGEQA